MTIEGYYIDSPEKKISSSELEKLGVFHWKLDPVNYEKEGKLDQICKERGYNYRDFVRHVLPSLFRHLHDDEEIRFFLEGSGFFDVRHENSPSEPWIRIPCEAGDLITLPAGIYHRFNPDDKMFFHVMRLFCGEPVWTAHNRKDAATEQRKARQDYVRKYVTKA